jgi:hypothetical protein
MTLCWQGRAITSSSSEKGKDLRWINAQLLFSQFFFLNDNLHVYYYHDPFTQKYYMDQRPVVSPNDNFHVYYYRDPVAHKYYMDKRPVVFFQ